MLFEEKFESNWFDVDLASNLERTPMTTEISRKSVGAIEERTSSEESSTVSNGPPLFDDDSWFIEKCESAFDRWSPMKYLPEDFQKNLKEISQSYQVIRSNRWFRKLRCDLLELCRLTSFQILIIWLMSLIMFISFFKSDCIEDSNAINGIDFDVRDQFGSLIFKDSNLSLWQNGSLERQQQHRKECNTIIACVLMNFVIASVLVLILKMYVCHIVESFLPFPWHQLELILSASFLIIQFYCSIIGCITTKENALTVLSLIQMILTIFFIINRYYKYRMELQPQQLSDDIDGDYFRKMRYYSQHQLIANDEKRLKESQKHPKRQHQNNDQQQKTLKRKSFICLEKNIEIDKQQQEIDREDISIRNQHQQQSNELSSNLRSIYSSSALNLEKNPSDSDRLKSNESVSKSDLEYDYDPSNRGAQKDNQEDFGDSDENETFVTPSNFISFADASLNFEFKSLPRPSRSISKFSKSLP
ncbi:Hepatoma-derived growth factor-related protein 3 [Sarcoptes scabiei]|nr:Hepatoma-derived growth factor-related protein 3 [Sarcoptes scabiei]